jgi:hypothetical protein
MIKFIDFSSHRSKDENGYLIVKDNPIAKAGVFEYLKSEIDGTSQSNKIVRVYRPFETLLKNKDSFASKPIKWTHEWVGKDGVPMADGAIGSNITADKDSLMLKADLIIYNPNLINAIENGLVELSPGYTGDISESKGRFNGEDYDAIQEVSCVNHLAVVEKGRSGRDLRILDQKPNLTKGQEMAKSKFYDNLIELIKKFKDSDGTEPVEPKVEDSLENKAKALLEIAKGEADDGEKLAKIIELLGVKDEEPKTQDDDSENEPKVTDDDGKDEPKVTDEDGEKEPKTQDDDETKTCDEDDKVTAFVDGLDKLMERKFKAFKDAMLGENKRIQDSYTEVSKALGQGFNYTGKSESEIYKIGYEALTNNELSQGIDAKSAFKTALNLRVPKFADSAIKTQDDSSKIDELLSKMKG